MGTAAYQHDIEFRTCNADDFSRLLIPTANKGEGSVIVASMFNINQIDVFPLETKQLKQATDSDPVLLKVLRFTHKDWPKEIDLELCPYHCWRNELSVEGCLLCVAVPTSCQKKVLEELHTSHPGIVKMKSIVHIHVWLPLIGQHIEEMVQSCADCQCQKQTSHSTATPMVMA